MISLRDCKTIKERRKFVEEKTKLSFEAINIYPKKLEEAQFKNCENMIGATSVPLGIAGPLKTKGKYAVGDYYIPLATTEGALVASVNRGCKTIYLSGGASVFQEFVGITRGSVFVVKNIKEGLAFEAWLKDNFLLLAKVAKKTSKHLSLEKIKSRLVGRNVYARFYFDTCDAMGMNMTTIATAEMVGEIEKRTKTRCVAVAGNFDIDKKPAWLNFILGRGRMLWAEVILSKEIVKSVLRTTPENIHDVVIRKCHIGSMISGSLGFNAHFANIIAAVFIACGQDVAHTVEGSLGITTTEIIDKDLYISIYLPDLPIGSIGGGTFLPAQKEAFSILGINSREEGISASKFAEVLAGAILAGEISLLASLAEGSLAYSHQRLARRKI